MKPAKRSSSAVARLLGKFLISTFSLAPAAPDVVDDDERDPVVAALVDRAGDLVARQEGAHLLALVLEELRPIDATYAASLASLSPRTEVRCALAEALTCLFPLVGDSVMLDHLSRDEDPAVRRAATYAAHARRGTIGNEVLRHLTHDPDPEVARLALALSWYS